MSVVTSSVLSQVWIVDEIVFLACVGYLKEKEPHVPRRCLGCLICDNLQACLLCGAVRGGEENKLGLSSSYLQHVYYLERKTIVLTAGIHECVFLFAVGINFWDLIFLLLSKWSAVVSCNAVALLNSRIIDRNYSSKEQRGETLETKILKLIVNLLFFLLCSLIFFVLFRKLILFWNENNSLKAMAQRHLIPGEPTERFLTARGTSPLVFVCLCFLCGRIALTRKPENRYPASDLQNQITKSSYCLPPLLGFLRFVEFLPVIWCLLYK